MGEIKESEISKAVFHRLDQWEKWGYVIFHDRYNSGKIPIGMRWVQLCKAGTPDRMAFIRINNVCWIYLIEVKNEDGTQSPKQIEFEDKFDGLENVIYEIIRSDKQVDTTLEKITKRSDKLMDEAGVHLFSTAPALIPTVILEEEF